MLQIRKYHRLSKYLSIILSVLIIFPFITPVINFQVGKANAEPDTTPPVVSITSPTGGNVNGIVDVSVYANDNIGVSRVEFYIDNTKVHESSVAPYVYSWDTTKYENISYNLVAKAYDGMGNTGTSSSVIVTVNNQPPVSSPTNFTAVASQYNTTLTWTDNSNNEDGFRIERKEGTGGTWQQIGIAGANVLTFKDESVVKPDMEYYYRVAAYNSVLSPGVSTEVKVLTPVTLTRTFQPDEATAQDTFINEGKNENYDTFLELYTGTWAIGSYITLINPPQLAGIEPSQITQATLT